jgi:hypothetical protein
MNRYPTNQWQSNVQIHSGLNPQLMFKIIYFNISTTPCELVLRDLQDDYEVFCVFVGSFGSFFV